MESDLIVGLTNARKIGRTVAVHCESQAVIDFHTERLRQAKAKDVYELAAARPPEAEAEAVRAVLALAKISGGSLHLVHMSDPTTVEFADSAKREGVDVSIETCPQYLILTKEDLKRITVWGVCQPPLHTDTAVKGMWKVLKKGLIDNVASDHCAYSYEEKMIDPWRVAPGITGIQVALPALVDGALRNEVPLSMIAKVFSAEPARRFSLFPKKGVIYPGAYADLVFIDTSSSILARAEDFFTRCPGTAFEGMTFGAKVKRTMVRGTSVYVDEEEPEILVEPGFGQFLRPRTSKT
jgi:allantoinase